MRIVSLLPSATEIVCALGLREQLVGVSHECDWPPDVNALPHVTRSLIPSDLDSGAIDAVVRERLKTERALYTLEYETLAQLRPDLLVTQALCDVCAVSERETTAAACSLPSRPQVVNLEPMRLAEVFECMRMVGEATGSRSPADTAIANLQARVDAVRQAVAGARRPRVIFVEWIDPLFCAGHWTPELIDLAGGVEVIGRSGQRSTTMRWEDVVAAKPEVLAIACCGFDTARTLLDMPRLAANPGYFDLPAVRTGRVYLFDGNAYFSRPGPRLVDSLESLATSLHPDRLSLPPHVLPATTWSAG